MEQSGRENSTDFTAAGARMAAKRTPAPAAPRPSPPPPPCPPGPPAGRSIPGMILRDEGQDMKYLLPCLVALAAPLALRAERPARPELVEVRKIWDRAPHNAFTDLTRFRGR